MRRVLGRGFFLESLADENKKRRWLVGDWCRELLLDYGLFGSKGKVEHSGQGTTSSDFSVWQ